MHYEVYANEEDGLWQWRIVNDEGQEIARSRLAHVHPGECHREIIQIQHLTEIRDVKQIRT